MDPGPYHPLLFWPHVFLGISSVLFALVAIFAPKGSLLHRSAGQTFAIFMGAAAVSAIYFGFVRQAPAPIISAFIALYGIGAGILTLRARNGGWRALQWLLILIPAAIALSTIAQVVGGIVAAGLPALLVGLPFLAFAVFFAALAWGDVAYLRARPDDRFRQFRRHALRMALVATETVRAPFMSFGPPLFGNQQATFAIYFFGTLVLLPIIYYFAMPDWVRRGEKAMLERHEAARLQAA